MKFIVQKSVIFKAMSHVQSIVEKKNALPILSNILIEAKDNNLTLSSTDMDISIIREKPKNRKKCQQSQNCPKTFGD